MTARPQDLGGRTGFGRVPIEVDEPVFHHDWEAPVIAGILATIGAGLYNVDQFREGIDDLDPLSYVSLGYYGRWLHTLEANCVRTGIFTEDELERRMDELGAGAPMPKHDDDSIAEGLRALIYEGAPSARDVGRSPAFAAGDRVRGRTLAGQRHSRLPRYAQGRLGTIERVHDAYPCPDTNRRGEGEQPEHVYSVRFESTELWPGGEGRSTVLIDVWESYLEPLGQGAR